MLMITLYAKQKKRHMYRTDFWTLWVIILAFKNEESGVLQH